MQRIFSPDNTLKVLGILVTIGFLMLVFWRSIFVTVRPGQIGVMFDLLFGGTQIADVYGEGLVTKFPWNQFYVYEARMQPINVEMVAYSREGMAVTVRATLLFKPKRESVPKLHQQIGPFYRDLVVLPLVTGSIREMVALYRSHEMYTVGYDKMQAEVEKALRVHPLNELIEFSDFIITEISLPQAITAAIERKLAQEQSMYAYNFMVETQKKEAERLRIEAEGLRGFYEVVGASLTPQLLTWRGIEATVDVARSPNAKVVIMGNGKGQLPLILGGDIAANTPDSAAPGAAKTAPAKSAASAALPHMNSSTAREIVADMLEKHDRSVPTPAPRFPNENVVSNGAAAPQSQLGSQDYRAPRMEAQAPAVGTNTPRNAFPSTRPVNTGEPGGVIVTNASGRVTQAGEPSQRTDQAIPVGPGALENQRAEVHSDRMPSRAAPAHNAAPVATGGSPENAASQPVAASGGGRRIDGGLGGLWRRWTAANNVAPAAGSATAVTQGK